MAEGHPVAFVFDDATGKPDATPGWFVPYLEREAVVLDYPTDYAAPTARLRHARTHVWSHPLGEVLSALNGAGLVLDWLHEHPRVTWRMFRSLVLDADGLFTWPDRPWLPLAYSPAARKRDTTSAGA